MKKIVFWFKRNDKIETKVKKLSIYIDNESFLARISL